MVLKINKSADNRSRSLREIQILNKLEHPHILRYVGACVHEGQLHPLTEYVDGGSLEDLLRDSKQEVPWRTRVKIARDIASGMAFLHSKKIYHRDLASKNCLLRKEKSGYTAVVADFGLAGEVPGEFSIRQPINCHKNDMKEEQKEETKKTSVVRMIKQASVDDGKTEVEFEIIKSPDLIRKASSKERRLSLRKVQSVVGSLYWMAPEVMKSQPYNELVDVFSYGILLCEIIARIDPDPDNLMRTSEFGLNREAFKETCRKEGLDCPPEFMEIAFDCCQVDPTERPIFPEIVGRLDELLKRYSDSSKLKRKSNDSNNDDDDDDERDRKASYCSQVEIKLRDDNEESEGVGDHSETSDARDRQYGNGEASMVEESGLPDGITRQPTVAAVEHADRKLVTSGGRSSVSVRRMSMTGTLESIPEKKGSTTDKTRKVFYV